MFMEKLSQQARSLWAKKSNDGSLSWLPLATHMVDSAAVAQKLWNRWVSGGVRQVVDAKIAENESAERLFVFLAAVHDLGKATPVFQAKKSAYCELDRWTVERIQRTGLPMKQHFIYLSRELRDYSPLQEMIAAITDCIRRSHSLTAVYDSYSCGKVTERIL